MQSNRLEKLLDFLENEPNDPFCCMLLQLSILVLKIQIVH